MVKVNQGEVKVKVMVKAIDDQRGQEELSAVVRGMTLPSALSVALSSSALEPRRPCRS